jgi:hypothetical protein
MADVTLSSVVGGGVTPVWKERDRTTSDLVAHTPSFDGGEYIPNIQSLDINTNYKPFLVMSCAPTANTASYMYVTGVFMEKVGDTSKMYMARQAVPGSAAASVNASWIIGSDTNLSAGRDAVKKIKRIVEVKGMSLGYAYSTATNCIGIAAVYDGYPGGSQVLSISSPSKIPYKIASAGVANTKIIARTDVGYFNVYPYWSNPNNWTQINTTGYNINNIFTGVGSICWTGNTFLIISESHSAGKISLTDVVSNWSPPSYILQSVLESDGNGNVLAMGFGGITCAFSTDHGDTWTQYKTPFRFVVPDAGQQIYVGITYKMGRFWVQQSPDDDKTFYSTTDGSRWVRHENMEVAPWNMVETFNEGMIGVSSDYPSAARTIPLKAIAPYQDKELVYEYPV